MSNPYNFGNPVPYEKFIGRRENLNEIIRDIVSPGGHSYAIIGGRRFGKTSFLEALQYCLINDFNQNISKLFPVLINLKRSSSHTADGVFGSILERLHQYFTMQRLRYDLGISLELNLKHSEIQAFTDSKLYAVNYRDFLKILDNFLDISHQFDLNCIAFLLDEAEAVVYRHWTDQLFDDLRSLIYDSELRKYVRLVIAGSSEIVRVRQTGSPLLNMLSLVYLEAIPKQDILQMVQWAEDVPLEVSDAILEQCGGHPFIAQYLMHFLWKKGISSTTADIVTELTENFKSERYADLYRWLDEIGTYGKIVYKCLFEQNDWLSINQVRDHIGVPDAPVDVALNILWHHGLAVRDGDKYKYTGELFKSWFIDNIVPSLIKSDKGPVKKELILKIHIDKKIFPTAYCYSLTATEYPFIKCEIDNRTPGSTDCRISVEAEIMGYSDICTDTINVESGKTNEINLLPGIKHQARLTLNEIRRTECRIIVQKHDKTGTDLFHDKTYPVTLHAANTALLATLNDADRIEKDLTDYLTVFVTPHIKEIEEAIRKAAEKHPNRSIAGYQGRPANDHNFRIAREIVRLQAEAFFDILKNEYGLLYTNTPLNFGKESNQITQRIRLPVESLKMRRSQANCIDGTVLFASLLEDIGVDPLIVIVKGHAFVGWRIWRNVNKFDFFETTMIGGDSTFDDALKAGNDQYNDALKKGYDKRMLFDLSGFIRIVDVAEARRKGINPLM